MTLDLHANITPLMVEQLDAAISYDHYPVRDVSLVWFRGFLSLSPLIPLSLSPFICAFARIRRKAVVVFGCGAAGRDPLPFLARSQSFHQ